MRYTKRGKTEKKVVVNTHLFKSRSTEQNSKGGSTPHEKFSVSEMKLTKTPHEHVMYPINAGKLNENEKNSHKGGIYSDCLKRKVDKKCFKN